MATDPRLARSIPRTATPPQPPPPPPPVSQQKLATGYDGTDDGAVDSVSKEDGGFKLKFCTVCASNQNRYVLAGVDVSVPGVNVPNITLINHSNEIRMRPVSAMYREAQVSCQHVFTSRAILRVTKALRSQIYGSPSPSLTSILSGHFLWNRLSRPSSRAFHHSAQRVSL